MIEMYSTEERLRIIKKFFITIPFIFICIWGLYQWLATFDILPYITIFNNNISTGFTYLRFKWEHRTSSIFPEPSEYAYFLGMFAPVVVSFATSKANLFSLRTTRFNKLWIVVLYISQCILSGSFSLFVMLPLVFYISLDQQLCKRKISITTFACIGIMLIGLILIFFIFGGRFGRLTTKTDSSTNSRFDAFLSAIYMFQESPITGVGYGTFRAMDHLSGTMAFLGVVGTIYFLFYVHKLKKLSRDNIYSKLLYKGYLCFILVGCSGNCLYEILPFWLIPTLIIVLTKDRGCMMLKLTNCRPHRKDAEK